MIRDLGLLGVYSGRAGSLVSTVPALKRGSHGDPSALTVENL